MVVLGAKLHPVVLINLISKVVAVAVWLLTDRPGVAVALFIGPDALVLYHLFMPSAQGVGRVFTRFATPRREVWLTIDDGPDPDDTPRLLDLLDRHEARATFFVIGERAARHPGLVSEILRRGHEIGHHTHTHPAGSFWCATPRRLQAELDRAAAALTAAGASLRWFRAPAGIKHLGLETALQARGLTYVGWTIRSGDCRARRPEDVVAHVVSRLTPGAIILMHEGISVRPAVRIRAIALFLEACTAQNYRLVLPERTQLRHP